MPKLKILINFCFFILGLFCFVQISLAANNPVLFFSDLIDGPKTGWNGSATKGVAVTIWGNNFGTTRGSSYVTVGGVNLVNDTDYAEWGVVANNARGMERITFWLNSNMTNGVGTIGVVVNGITANNLSFYVRTTGNIRFVDHNNGNNANNGQTDTAAWKTLAKARQSISGGDIVYVRAGTYNETDADGKLLLLTSAFSGSDNNYTAFVGYPTEVATLDTVPNMVGSAVGTNYTYNGSVHHIVTAKLKILPYLSCWVASQQPLGHFRVIALDIDGQNGTYPVQSTWGGCIDFHDQSDGVVYGSKLYGWGRDKFDHFIYLGEDLSSVDLLNYDFGWNEVHDLGPEVSGIYIHPQDTDANNKYADNIKIHDNLAYNLTHAGIILNSRYINVYIYNNLLYHSGLASAGRGALYLNGTNTTRNISNVRVYNNTIHSGDTLGLLVFLTSVNVSFRNNIFYSENNQPYYFDSNYNGTRSSDYNAWYGRGVRPAWATGTNDLNNINPLIASLTAHDFRLLASSPAINAGVDANAIATKDYDGVSRPQGGVFDIGAYEYISQTFHPADTNQNNKIEMNELIAFIAKWKTNQAVLSDVLDVLGKWLRGE